MPIQARFAALTCPFGKRLRRVFLFLTLSATLAFCQDRGTITGTVTDPSGAAVPETQVEAKNVANGLTQSVKTGPEGNFALLYLPVGVYTVTADKAGFRKAQANEVRVQVNSTSRLDIHMSIGSVDQTVEVTSATPLLTTEGSNLGKVTPTRAILDLPLFINGGIRSTTNFVILTPGVIGDQGNPRIGGGLLDGQSIYLDGAESQSQRRNDPGMNGVSVEALQEFKVQSSSYSAEYGRMSNGVINFATKSGTNQLHGNAFEFFRNEKLDARGFTFGPGVRGTRRQNNPGFSLGGPIFIPKVVDGRNKLFFFTAFEYANFRGPDPTNLVTVPTDAMRNGDFRGYTDARGNVIPLYDPLDANGNIIQDPTARPRLSCNGVLNVICPNRIDPLARQLQSILPEPDNPSQIFNNTRAVGNPLSRSNVFSIKGDYVINEKHRLSVFFSRYFSPAIAALGPVPGIPSRDWGSSVNIRYYRVNEDFIIRPNLVNHITIGFDQRHILENPGNNNGVPDAYRQAVQIPGTTVGGFPGHMTRYDTEFLSYGTHVGTDSRQRSESLYEQLAWSQGKHNLKFGFQYYKGHYRRLDCNNCPGTVNFSANATGNPGVSGQTGSNYAAFLLGLANGGSFNYSADIDFFFPYYAWFVQDDFKVNNKLTLNIGLRYEVPIPKQETRFQNSNFCPACPNPAAGGIPGAMIFAGNGPGRSGIDHFGDTRLNAFGPRLGFAYQATSTTVIRAGSALFYQPTREDGNADNGVQGFGGNFNAPSNFLGNGIAFRFPNGFNTFASAVQANKPPVIDPGIQLYGSPFYYNPSAGRAPYFADWDFTVEQSVAKNSVFRVSYHATVGVRLLSKKQVQNQLDPRYLSLYGGTLLSLPISDPRVQALRLPLPYAGYPTTRQLQQMLRPYPQYNSIDSNAGGQNDGHSTWHALEASFDHRFANGLYFVGSYTFSKLISNTDGEDANRGDPSGQNQYNRALDKAVGLQDQTHVFNLSYVYELPVGRGKRFLSNMPKVANAILGNWRISGVQRYTSGYPIGLLAGQNLFGASGTVRPSFAPGAGTTIPLINPNFNWDNPGAAPYINPAAFVRPPNGVYGNTPRNIAQLRSPKFLSEDISILKNFHFTEQKFLELRASAFNVANRHILGGIANASTTNNISNNIDNATFGMILNPQSSALNPRSIQLGAKLVF
jgi:hypothetical protein